ncbi:ATP-dependent zinc metalloprotease FtsH [Weissella soli]|uniref:ATP-dependent zinc metalloprotease FtsH n=1 Tax=Weissella soli TaxID=155866 RepID=A0A288QVA8_9LACO|nr:ATP-dependent zinc metalloprotease FtsH [Weissella soli]AOT57048.1 ATP-dependent zinc metalloprotease FtsH [Weissella soli]NKY83980.1 ATP-dependent zinc metalloprotease FtsH [Weissella soli]RDL01058.1 cell division protease FtsH [Weissella soli]GEN93895.1 ATP-dependent zinc metalloprotease FtsH [Weissella soli]
MNNRPNGNGGNGNNFVRNSLFYVIVILAILGLVYWFAGPTQSTSVKKVTTSEFITQMKDKQIKSIEIQPGAGVYDITGTYRKAQTSDSSSEDLLAKISGSKTTKVTTFTTQVLSNDPVVEEIQTAAAKTNTDITTKPESSNMWGSVLVTLVPVLLMIGFFYLMMGGMRNGGGNGAGGMMGFGKSKAKPSNPEDNKIRFGDVAGAEEEKQELVEVVEFLKDPAKFTKLGAKIPKGVLLEGPPGTGKTLLARAVAGEAGVPFYSISGSDFVEMFVGVGASRVRDLFENAKKTAPSIIFIDEIDAVGRQRGAGMGGGHDEREQTLNQMLVEMDGFEGNESVIVMAATNRADVLDPALLRPGRFDRKILVGRPDVKGREAILNVHAKNKPLAADVDLKEIAKQTPGFVGADLANLLNEAALLAARQNKSAIEAVDVDEAEDRVIAGPAKRDRVVSEKERKTVAYHEAGHAIVGLVLNDARVVHKVTIVPRGRAGGYAIMLPREDQMLMNKTDAMDQIAGLMGGRAAEEIVFNQQSSGASNDFEQATGIARSMVTEYGMSDKLGMVQLEGGGQPFLGRQYGESPAYSDQTAHLIDEEVRRLTTEGHQKAHDIIVEYADKHEAIAQALLKYETLDEKQILSLFETGEMPKDSRTGDYASDPMTYDQALEEANRKVAESVEGHRESGKAEVLEPHSDK